MSGQLLRLLAVDDQSADIADMARCLESAGHRVETMQVVSDAGMRAALAESSFDLVVSAYQLRTFSALEALHLAFLVMLPSAAGPVARTPSRRGFSSLPRGTETVLLVEDEPGVRELIRDFLDRCGYTVLEANDPAQAIDLFDANRGRLQLLITDVVMPQMNGRELAEQLVRQQPDLRVLFMSGYTDDHVLAHGVARGAGFLQKPFTPDVLARKVRDVLDGGARAGG